MKKEIALVLLTAALVSGFLLGREFPRHHYQAASPGNAFIILDTATGKVCDARTPENWKPLTSTSSVFAGIDSPNAGSGIPYCGK